MASFARRSILKQLVIVAACVLATCISDPQLLAQHTRSAGGGAHVSAPISHAPVPQPSYRAPTSAARFSAGAGGSMGWFRPPHRPIRPFPTAFGLYASPFAVTGGLWQFNSCWWASCELFWILGYNSSPLYADAPANYVAAPEYEPSVYGEAGEDLPELYLKDGTVLNVTDYWVVDGQLHFTMIEAYGAKPVEHTIPFHALELQKSIDANTQRGFRFILRNEPVEQYMRDHPGGAPPDAPPIEQAAPQQ
jgi:hypothetical protein